MHRLSSQPTPSPSSSFFQVTLSHHRHLWHCQEHSPHLLRDGHSSHFLPAPDTWPPPVPLALPMLSTPPPELDTLPLPTPPLHAPSVLSPSATSGSMPVEAPPTSSSTPQQLPAPLPGVCP